MKTEFGLIGHPLSHSFSQRYFREKFSQLGLSDHDYHLFDLNSIEELTSTLKHYPNLVGLNVTIPYKQAVIPYLTQLDASAQKVGAVNVIRIKGDERIGYNSDYYGFKQSLEPWLPKPFSQFSALILGTGGASKAVKAALVDLDIPFQLVSRKKSVDTLSYEQLNADPRLIANHKLIINTTPVGMHPHSLEYPDIPTHLLTDQHFVYDLVYNPEKTMLLSKAQSQLARIKNGLEMLHLQAEKSWEIWNA